jgi:hypothetical protein
LREVGVEDVEVPNSLKHRRLHQSGQLSLNIPEAKSFHRPDRGQLVKVLNGNRDMGRDLGDESAPVAPAPDQSASCSDLATQWSTLKATVSRAVPLADVGGEQLILALLHVGKARIVAREAGRFALKANELRPCDSHRLAGLFQEVGVDEPDGVVIGIGADRPEKAGIFLRKHELLSGRSGEPSRT